MATWVRTPSGTLPSSGTNSDLAIPSSSALTFSDSAPADFDPAAVNSVRLQYSITGTGFSDDSWEIGSDGGTLGSGQITLRASSGSGLSSTSFTVSNISGLQNVTQDIDELRSDIIQTYTVAQWEGIDAVGTGGGTLTGTVTLASRNMGPDGYATSLDSLTVTIDYTPSSSTQDLTPSALSVSPTFPTATLVQEQFLTPTLLTIPTTFPFATINQQIQGALLSLTPTFPTGEIKAITILASTLVSLIPSFPQAQLNQGINASLHSITVSFPTATIGSFTVIQGVLASLTASFGTATVTSTYDITPARLDVGLSFPGAAVEGAGTVQDIQPTTLSLSPSFPTAKMGISVLGSVLAVGPSFGTATIGLTVKANTLGVLPTFPISDIDPVYDIPAASVQLFPTFGTAVVTGDQALTPDTLMITAIFPSGNLTFAGTPLTPIDTEGQGIAQEMCAARGLSGDLDWLGSLNALNGGTDLDKLGVLHALGATPNADLLLSLEQLAFDGQGPGDFNELMRRWAESGNF